MGDYTVVNDRGSTTYKVNQNNPNKNSKSDGFETKKRVDYRGAAHVDKKIGQKAPIPMCKKMVKSVLQYQAKTCRNKNLRHYDRLATKLVRETM